MGKLEPKADRTAGVLRVKADRTARVLRVKAIHQDVPFTGAATEAIGDELRDLAGWLEPDLTLPR